MQLKLNFSSDIDKIVEEYMPNNDPFNEDTDQVHLLKTIISNDLSDVEKRLILLYTEYRSFRKVAKLLNISNSTVYNYISTIKKKIQSKYTDAIKHNYSR